MKYKNTELEPVQTGFQLHGIGNKELVIEGSKGVLLYDTQEICINVGSSQLKIKGRNLTIPSLERHCTIVQGFITEINFI